MSEFATKAPTHGWNELSTVLVVTSGATAADSTPMVTQLSNASVGKNPNKAAFNPSAVPPLANASL